MIAATIAALTIYDMTKALDKHITIESVRLLEKTGGTLRQAQGVRAQGDKVEE